MKIRNLAVISALLLAATIIAVPVVSRRHDRSTTTDDIKTLRLGVQDNVICALPFIAHQKGFFHQQGISVEIQKYPSGSLALAAMFEGKVDMTACADLPVMSGSFERDDFAVFGTIAWTDQGAWIIARKDAGISAPKDLRGKRVATQRDSAVHFFLSVFLARHGIDEHEVALSYMKAVDLPQALAEGRIDAFSMRNPFIAQARALIGDSTIELFDADIYRQTFNLVTWKQSLDSNRHLYEQFLRALVSAEQLIFKNEEEARGAVIAELGAARSTEVLTDWRDYTFALSLDQSIFATLEDQARWAIARNPKIAREIPNYMSFIDTRPMLSVKPAAVSVIH